MGRDQSQSATRHLVALFRTGAADGLTDGQLLGQFTAVCGEMGEAAFRALVERHGPMVLRVCRQALGDHHDAEDAFQATFLVLARKAAAIRRRASVLSPIARMASAEGPTKINPASLTACAKAGRSARNP